MSRNHNGDLGVRDLSGGRGSTCYVSGTSTSTYTEIEREKSLIREEPQYQNQTSCSLSIKQNLRLQVINVDNIINTTW